MTPLEAALTALKSVKMDSGGMQSLDDYQTEQVRAVILALSKCDLPGTATQAGIDAATDLDSGEDTQPTDRAFRAMLRSIATEGKDNGA